MVSLHGGKALCLLWVGRRSRLSQALPPYHLTVLGTIRVCSKGSGVKPDCEGGVPFGEGCQLDDLDWPC